MHQRNLIALITCLICSSISSYVAAENADSQRLEFFESKVRPLLVEHCYECHSEASSESSGGLLLDTAVATLRGGSQGPALLAGNPEQSLIIRAVNYDDPDLQMPPDGRLDQSSIEVLRHWIKTGATDPRRGSLTESVSPLDRDPLTHWAFVKPEQSELPFVKDASSRDPIDALADRAAGQHDLTPNPTADKKVLIRRLYYDLTGLPPTYDDVQTFVASDRPDAYTRLVDQLLSTPAFGERFARHWLDVSRYANTLGYTTGGKSREYEGSERFRDWAIRAFAQDMPYDEMIRHQLSGDRTDPSNENGNLDAMGFLTLGRKFLNGFDTKDDQIDVITRGLLGMTVACARCHDHKFDPISTADYYSLLGIISSSEKPKNAASPLMWADKTNPADHPILIRGQRGNHGPVVPRQFLTALRKSDEPRFTDGSGRWELAQRIASPENPLTARVMVNRIWGHLIGKPLVATPSDFGFRTEPPAVPEMLDELAVDFAQHWSIKRLVRRIVTSHIYRQSTEPTDDALRLDPDNRWLTRANRKRRDFESLRDTTLSIAGVLERSLGGLTVEITGAEPNPRRTVYARINRQNLPPIFRTFDFASPDTHSPQRYFTTVPQQALFMMNNDQMLTLARRSAARIRQQTRSDKSEPLAVATFRTVLGRDPTADEKITAVEFLRQPTEPLKPALDPRSVWSYGTSHVDSQNRPLNFASFPVFRKDRWQSKQEFPAPAPDGHASLTRSGGHPPAEADRAVVRRFVAPWSGSVTIIGTAGHANDKGDGVQVSVFIDGQRMANAHCQKSEQPIKIETQRIERGQQVDFVTSPGKTSSFDSFSLAAVVQLTDETGSKHSFGTRRHYGGLINPQSAEPLDRIAQLAHTLMMTNELAFVD